MHHDLDDISESDGQAAAPEAQEKAQIAHLPVSATQLIGERIRSMYAKLANEPVPGPLLELIRQLENKERSE